jgi:ligand-binding sensor domain-containing protein
MCGRVENSFRTGITIFDRAGNEFSHVESYGGLLHRPDAVNDICAGREDIFAATDDGVWVIDRIEKKTRLLPGENNGLPDGAAFTLLMLGDTLLTGTEHGLVTTVVRGDTIETIYETILPSLAILSLKMVNDDLWIGTSQGAYRMDWQTGSIGLLSTSEITETGFVFDIEFDGQRVWLATEYELAAIDINNAEIEVFPEVNNYGGARAVAVADTIVAVATVRGLLLLYTGESPQYEFFTDEDGLPSVNIRDLIFDEEYLWLATDRGLCRFLYNNPDLYRRGDPPPANFPGINILNIIR